MAEKEASDLYIGSRDAKLVSGREIKAKAAVEARPAIKAVPEQLDEEGNVLQERIKGQKEIKASDAVPGSYVMKIGARNQQIMEELIVRMNLEGVEVKEGSEIEATADGVTISFQAETQSQIRLALKNAKGKGKNNAKGLAIFEAEKRAKAQEEAEARKEKEEKEKASKADDKSEAPKTKKKKAVKKNDKKGGKKVTAKPEEKSEENEEEGWGE